jgi:hypothetical protein
MELVEIARIAINETDQAKIRGAIDIKVPFVVCPEAIVESQLAPARLIGEAASPVPTLYDSFPSSRPRLWRQAPIGLLDRTLAATSNQSPARLLRRPVIEVHEILESIEPASVTAV